MNIRMPFASIAILAVTIFITSGVHSHDVSSVEAQKSQKTALSFDADDVISGKNRIGILDYFTLIIRMFFYSPMIITAMLPSNQAAITQYATEIQKTVNGGSNVVHSIVGYLKDNGYGDLSYYEPEIIQRSQKPYPVVSMIEHIKRLKDAGYIVIGATNQDYLQHQAYRAYLLAQYGIDLNQLFDAVLTTNVYHAQQPADDGKLYYRMNGIDNIYVTRNKEDYKPHEGYFKVVEQLIKNIAPTATQIIHTDDKKENIEAAQKAGLKAIHFNLPDGSIRKTTPAELRKAIATWENELKVYGVPVL